MPTATVRITVRTEKTTVQTKIAKNGFWIPSSWNTRVKLSQPMVTV